MSKLQSIDLNLVAEDESRRTAGGNKPDRKTVTSRKMSIMITSRIASWSDKTPTSNTSQQ